jgi:carotenoid cleavage dioxygenase-like enzyme
MRFVLPIILAHPKIDHATGELIFFGYPPTPIDGRKVHYHVADK